MIERLPRLQRPHRGAGDDRGDLRKRALLADDDSLEVRQARAREVAVPVEAGRELDQLGDRHRIVFGNGIALLDPRPARFGDRVLERQDIPGARHRLGPVHQVEQRGRVVLIRRPCGRELGLEVIVAVGKTEPGLVEVDRVDPGILEIHIDVDVEDAAVEAAVAPAHERRERRACPRRAHRGEMRRQRGRAEPLDGGRVHVRPVVRADLGFEVGRLVRRLGCGRFHDRAQAGFGRVAHQEPEGDSGLIHRDGRAVEPTAVHAGEKVVAGARGGVLPRQVEAPGAILRPRLVVARRRFTRRRARADQQQRGTGALSMHRPSPLSCGATAAATEHGPPPVMLVGRLSPRAEPEPACARDWPGAGCPPESERYPCWCRNPRADPRAPPSRQAPACARARPRRTSWRRSRSPRRDHGRPIWE